MPRLMRGMTRQHGPNLDYFSVDGGTTNLGDYDASDGSQGDYADWNANSNMVGDPFGGAVAGTTELLTGRDIITMAAIGWKMTSAGVTLANNAVGIPLV